MTTSDHEEQAIVDVLSDYQAIFSLLDTDCDGFICAKVP